MIHKIVMHLSLSYSFSWPTYRILGACVYVCNPPWRFCMQDLCAICTDFIISELWTSNFLAYQVQDAYIASLYITYMPPVSMVIDCICS